jgi:arylsulfatase A-like enzyme
VNVLFVSIDSLRRDVLSTYRDEPYCVDYEVDTPNLDRFAERAAVFDTHYAGSLPCMPARREWHAGVQEFLWRPWGPLEPFDDSLPVLARDEGVLTALLTDHYHYFQHGSHGYYEGYNGFEFVRGHEHDAWRTAPRDPDETVYAQSADRSTDHPHSVEFLNRAAYARNVDGITDEAEFFSPRLLSRTAEWLADNEEWDDWYCYVDSFDVHEPFHCPEPYASMYTDEDPRDPELTYWPYYGRVDEGQSELTDRELSFVQSQFAGKVTMTDRWFGRVLDALDDRELWDETMVVVTSDHGYMLGEHGWIAKNLGPVYDVIARTPLFVWHPDGAHNGGRIDALTSAVDIYATILDALDVPVPGHVHSRSLLDLLSGDASEHRERALYGYWGSSVCVTDGEHTYLRPCDGDAPAYCYSTTMMNARSPFVPNEPKVDAEAGQFLPYTDSPVWRYEDVSYVQHEEPLLFDVREDPFQQDDLHGTGTDLEDRMVDHLRDGLSELEAPDWQYERLGLAR